MMSNKKNKLSRRKFLGIGLTGAISLKLAQNVAAKSLITKNKMLLYIGTYTSNSKSEGIYIYDFDLDSGDLNQLFTVKNVTEPSFLTVGKERKFLYSVNELLENKGEKGGAVSAFSIDQKTGNLQFLNKQPSLGGAPCYLTTSKNGKFVLTANYLGGNVSVNPVNEDGTLGESVELIQHSGSSVNKRRQEAAHAHSVNLDNNNRFAIVADLGIDKLMIYAFDDQTGKLTPNSNQPFYQTKAGAGSRHFTFHPNGKFGFLINELDLTISSLAYDETLGTLTEIQTISTVPAGVSGSANSCAEVVVSPNGKFLYGSNRGHNSIVSYRIDEETGKLEYLEHVSTKGKTPRNFIISPDGKFLLAANQDSNNIVVFRLDEETGKLQPTETNVQVPKPVCLKLIPSFNN